MNKVSGKIKNSSDLKERYIYAVTKRLPAKTKDDIENEIRTLIDDMAEDMYPTSPDSFEAIRAVLLKLGNPKKLAEKYSGSKNYLIGPDQFDNYITVLKIVLIAVTGAMLLTLIIKNVVDTPSNVFVLFGETVSTLLSALVGAFAWVTLIFALIGYNERKNAKIPSEESNIKKEDWDISDLPEIPARKALVSKSETIFGIIFYIIFFVLFNYAPQFIGIIAIENDITKVVPFLNLDNVKSFVIIVNIILALGLIREVAKLIEGKYTFRLSVFSLIASSVSLILTIILVKGSNFWNQSFLTEIKNTFGIDKISDFNLENSIMTIAGLFIGVAVVIFIAENISNFYKSFKYGSK